MAQNHKFEQIVPTAAASSEWTGAIVGIMRCGIALPFSTCWAVC
ncbi:hypothetical protein [Tenggerimyces flavus]|uniref:Uncharacterized protein n=1 Tax=Tenggerimyces flavus TaxID=1708749 RepID=A0ABV7YR07_9ACTN|nr:hypothetical protein [Tenggerimyces flavus]MBM7790371.1 hypothetical protein [Tenggerimyces flavus]